MKSEFRSLGKGYLYTFHNGKLREYYGEVLCDERSDNRPCIFTVLNEHKKRVKSLVCAFNEGEIYNKAVWLHTKNASVATKKLIDYEENEIVKLENRIQNHKDIIEFLRKEIES